MVGSYIVTPSGLSSPNYFITWFGGILSIWPATTTVNVIPSANPSGNNQAVTFSATVGVVAPGAGLPKGLIEFRDGSTRLGTVALNSGDTVTLTTNGLSVGSHAISAVYLGETNYFAGSTGSLTHTVNAASTSSTVTVTSSANPRRVGQSLTLTATVSAPAGGVTGTIQFYDGATLLGSGTVASNKVTLTTTSLASGGHAITARYSGNASVPPSVSPVFVQTMTPTSSTPKTPTISMSASPSPSTLDGPVTFTATVTGTFLSPRPTGRVVFFANGQVIGDPAGVVLAAGSGSTQAVATFSTSALAHGTHTITAVYTADSTYRGVAASTSLIVN
jgi:hypothetical protein